MRSDSCDTGLHSSASGLVISHRSRKPGLWRHLCLMPPPLGTQLFVYLFSGTFLVPKMEGFSCAESHSSLKDLETQ